MRRVKVLLNLHVGHSRHKRASGRRTAQKGGPPPNAMSALILKADMCGATSDVR
jgi:hypothetical protein